MLVQADVLPGPVAEQGHVVAGLLYGRGWRRSRFLAVVVLLVVVVVLLMVMLLLVVVLLLVVLLRRLLLDRGRGAAARASHRLERG